MPLTFCSKSVPEAVPLSKDWTFFTADSFWEQSIVKTGFLFLKRKIVCLVTVRLHPGAEGCLHGSVICWLAVKGIGKDKRYFPFCSREKPICFLPRHSAGETLHEQETCQSSLETLPR